MLQNGIILLPALLQAPIWLAFICWALYNSKMNNLVLFLHLHKSTEHLPPITPLLCADGSNFIASSVNRCPSSFSFPSGFDGLVVQFLQEGQSYVEFRWTSTNCQTVQQTHRCFVLHSKMWHTSMWLPSVLFCTNSNLHET